MGIRISGAVKCEFRPYAWWFTSPNENFEYGYLNFNALVIFLLQKERKNVSCELSVGIQFV